jgi:Fur family transcriptional regulator, zinc uptake regulator
MRVRHPQHRREDRRQRDLPTNGVDRDAVEARARFYAASKGTPFTPMRQRVLAVLGTSDKPLSAYEIAGQISDKRKVHGVEVYRALEFLRQAGCIHRLASRSSYFPCDHLHGEGEAAVFMVCQECGAVHEMGSEVVARGLKGAAKTMGFKLAHSIVEVEGECAKCAAAHPA